MNVVDKNAMTTLDYAAINGCSALVSRLLDGGAITNVGSGSRRSSPLVHAVEAGDLETAVLLIKAGADLNAPQAGRTPLSFAALTGRLDLLRVLIEAGADLDLKSEDSLTPLMSAVAGGNVEAVELLTRVGASINPVNTATGETALDIAEDRKRTQIIRLLRNLGAIRGKEIAEGSFQTEEPGTFWQLPDNSMLTLVTNPWPPKPGETLFKAEVTSDDDEQAFQGTIDCRITVIGCAASAWEPMSVIGVSEQGEAEFGLTLRLPKGKLLIECRVRPGGAKGYTFLDAWRLTVS